MLLVEHKFNTSCQSFTMWFLGFEKKEKKKEICFRTWDQ